MIPALYKCSFKNISISDIPYILVIISVNLHFVLMLKNLITFMHEEANVFFLKITETLAILVINEL